MSSIPLLMHGFARLSHLALRIGSPEHHIPAFLIEIVQKELISVLEDENCPSQDLSVWISVAISNLQALQHHIEELDALKSNKIKRVLKAHRKPELEKNIREISTAAHFNVSFVYSILSRRQIESLNQSVQRLAEAQSVPNSIKILRSSDYSEKSHQCSSTEWNHDHARSIHRRGRPRFSTTPVNSSKCRSGACGCKCHGAIRPIGNSQRVLSGSSFEAVFTTCQCPSRMVSWTILAFQKHINVCFTIVYERGFSLTFSPTIRHTVPRTSPSFVVLFKCREGLMGFEEAITTLNSIFVQGASSIHDIDRDGNSLVEVSRCILS